MALTVLSIVSRQQLAHQAIWDMQLHPTQGKYYVGGMYSPDPERKNLTVLDGWNGPRTSYADVSVPLTLGNRSSVVSIAVLPTKKKLYLLSVEEGTTTGILAGYYLTIYHLAATGAVTGAPTCYRLNNGSVNLDDRIVLHPKLPLLYISNGAAVDAYTLNANWLIAAVQPTLPLPTAVPAASFVLSAAGNTLNSLSVHAGGKRIYAGTNENKFIIGVLDNMGMLTSVPTVMVDTAYPDLFCWGADALDGIITQTFHLFVTTKALYRRARSIDGWLGYKRGNFPLRVWPLDINGDPVSANPQVFPLINADGGCFYTTNEKLYTSRVDYFTDALDGVTKRAGGFSVQSYKLDAQGLPQTPPSQLGAIYNEEPFLLRGTPKGIPVVLTKAFDNTVYPAGAVQVSNQFLRCTVTGSNPAIVAGQNWSVAVTAFFGSADGNSTTVNLTNASATVPLDPLLLKFTKYPAANVKLLLSFELLGPVPVDSASWQLEYFFGDPAAGGQRQQKVVDTCFGNKVIILMDSMDVQPFGLSARGFHFELLSSQWQSWALDAALSPAVFTPVKFIVSAYQFVPRQAHQQQLVRMNELVKSLGFNTFIIDENEVFAALPAAVSNTAISKAGSLGYMGAVYNPFGVLNGFGNSNTGLEYFDFCLDHVDLQGWADYLADNTYLLLAGKKFLNFMIADEPGWRYQQIPVALMMSPAILATYLASLHDWLELNNLLPADFGEPDWNSVRWVAAPPDSNTAPLVDRILYYWTVRFLQFSAARGFYQTKTALQTAFKGLQHAPVNFNNMHSEWKINDVLLADWFECGRSGKQTLWTEAWVRDNDPWEWSFRMDLLSSAANTSHGRPNKDIQVGSYVIGQVLGGHPAGALYKVFTLVSRNGKIIDFYNLGTFNAVNPWVMAPAIYPAIAASTELLAKAEPLLFDGVPPRGHIALFSTGASTLWDDISNPDYTGDLKGIYLALMHEGYTVDFVDDTDIVSGFLTTRSYLILYITAPNVSDKACTAISQWVDAGGTIVVTAGAATMTEYNEPSQRLDATLGMTNRRHSRGSTYYYGGQPANAALVSAALHAPLPAVLTYGISAVASTGAVPLYNFSTGEAGITLHQYGLGNALLYNFLPGVQYFNARYDLPLGHSLPITTKWQAAYRDFTLLPLQYTPVPKGVTIANHSLIEAVRMESATGLAIVIFNWNNAQQTNITINVPVSSLYTKVVSAQGTGIHQIVIKAASVQFVLKTLEYVDVVMLT